MGETVNQAESDLRDIVSRMAEMLTSGQSVRLRNESGCALLANALKTPAHLENWAEVLKECTRLSKGNIIFDYPTALSFNFFSPLLFNLKKRIEGNTRRYTVFTERRLRRELDSCGFKISRRARQFFLPMALHRLCDCPKLSIGVEGLSKVSGLTKHFGSPAVLLAQKEVLNRPAQ